MARRTITRMSENVRSPSLLYQEATSVLTSAFVWCMLKATSVTKENSPIKRGVVRAIALSDHCRCVSTPSRARVSSNVTSIYAF